ncbi:MAG: Fic family protein [bacterium]|nr:Fic family protein [bacterium]
MVAVGAPAPGAVGGPEARGPGRDGRLLDPARRRRHGRPRRRAPALRSAGPRFRVAGRAGGGRLRRRPRDGRQILARHRPDRAPRAPAARVPAASRRAGRPPPRPAPQPAPAAGRVPRAGARHVRGLQPAPDAAADPARSLAALLARSHADLEDDRVHPLLAIAAVTGGILALQPFQDGNGRLSRLLATLLLLKHGYGYATSASLDRVFEDDRAVYDEAARRLREAGAGQDVAARAAWTAFFLDCLAGQVEALAERIDQEQRMAPLPPLSETIFAAVRAHGRVTVRAATALTGANRNTVKAHLQRLVAEGRLVRRGQRKGTWYELPGGIENGLPQA